MRNAGFAVLAVVLLAACGCVPLLIGAGAGTVAVREATDVARIYKGNISAVENGVRKAMKDLGAKVVELVTKEGKAGRRTIRGRTFDNERLTIDMEPTSPSSVMVEIRVGRLGNKERSKEFHKALQKYLKKK